MQAVAVDPRVSTQRQANTPEQQLERLRTYVQAQGWNLPPEHVFRDDGYSGATLHRPGRRRHAPWPQEAPAAARYCLVPGTPNLELRSAARLADKPNLYGPSVCEPSAHRAGAHARLGAAAGRSKRVQPAPYGPDRVDRGRLRAGACRPGPVRSGAGAVGV